MNMKIKSIIRPDALRGISLLVRVALGLTAVCAVASDPGERTVTGRLAAPPDCHWNLSETKGLLMQELPAFPIPPDVKSKGRRAQDEWFQKWKLTEEGQAFLSQPRKKYDLRVAGGGSFSIAKVVPGNYWLCYSYHDQLEKELVCMGKKTFSLSVGATPFALGSIQMTVRPFLKKGERAPRFAV
jgi:hypothetical protein